MDINYTSVHAYTHRYTSTYTHNTCMQTHIHMCMWCIHWTYEYILHTYACVCIYIFIFFFKKGSIEALKPAAPGEGCAATASSRGRGGAVPGGGRCRPAQPHPGGPQRRRQCGGCRFSCPSAGIRCA